jgi:uncharacterized Zn finger protein (UPF0148 family)
MVILVAMSEQAADKDTCADCTCPFPEGLAQCPHCGRPAVFPNVRQTSRAAEVEALKTRYESAMNSPTLRGQKAQLESFGTAVARSSAVISRSLNEATRLARSDDQGYATYYQLLHSGARFPAGDEWDRLRQLADVELFGVAAENIRFGLLSLNDLGLPHYGEVSLVLHEKMVGHRATAFEENSAVFFQKCRQKGEEPPRIRGHRARWEDRDKLAIAKHGAELTSGDRDWATILTRAGEHPAEDVFIEVHVYGSLTRRSLRRVLARRRPGQSAALFEDMRDRLSEVQVKVEEIE